MDLGGPVQPVPVPTGRGAFRLGVDIVWLCWELACSDFLKNCCGAVSLGKTASAAPGVPVALRRAPVPPAVPAPACATPARSLLEGTRRRFPPGASAFAARLAGALSPPTSARLAPWLLQLLAPGQRGRPWSARPPLPARVEQSPFPVHSPASLRHHPTRQTCVCLFAHRSWPHQEGVPGEQGTLCPPWPCPPEIRWTELRTRCD